MKVLSLTEPCATLLKKRKNLLKQEVGKQIIVENCIYMQVQQGFLRIGWQMMNL